MVVVGHIGILNDSALLGHHLTFNGVFRIAVPVFFIINGFYFYTVVSNNRQIMWLKRIMFLYISWMIFYSYFWFSIPEFSFIGIMKLAIKIIIGYHHLWYISGMIGAALVVIAFRKLSSLLLIISILLTFFCGVLIQYLGNYHVFEGTILDKLFNYTFFHRNFLLLSYPFFCLGYLINKHSLHKSVSFKQAGILSIFGILVLLFESYVNYHIEGRDGGFDNLFSLLIVAPFIFLLFMKSKIIGKSENIALYSSSIYFIHAFIINIFHEHMKFDAIVLAVTVILTSVIASYFIIKLNIKWKFIL
jgi:surface polysaccharide O-acyltransferase-like enzyme